MSSEAVATDALLCESLAAVEHELRLIMLEIRRLREPDLFGAPARLAEIEDRVFAASCAVGAAGLSVGRRLDGYRALAEAAAEAVADLDGLGLTGVTVVAAATGLAPANDTFVPGGAA